eukprot:m.414249 g.414249  ORF g.414249 m.414249 type:complete len:74 (-) comp29290_c0_seq1:124-345(-)
MVNPTLSEVVANVDPLHAGIAMIYPVAGFLVGTRTGGKANIAANGMLGAVIGLAAAATDTMIRSAVNLDTAKK